MHFEGHGCSCLLFSLWLPFFLSQGMIDKKSQAVKTHTVVQPAFNAPMGPLHLLKLSSELSNNIQFPPHSPGIPHSTLWMGTLWLSNLWMESHLRCPLYMPYFTLAKNLQGLLMQYTLKFQPFGANKWKHKLHFPSSSPLRETLVNKRLLARVSAFNSSVKHCLQTLLGAPHKVIKVYVPWTSRRSSETSAALSPISLSTHISLCVFVHCVSYVGIVYTSVLGYVPVSEYVEFGTGFQGLFLCFLPYYPEIRPPNQTEACHFGKSSLQMGSQDPPVSASQFWGSRPV